MRLVGNEPIELLHPTYCLHWNSSHQCYAHHDAVLGRFIAIQYESRLRGDNCIRHATSGQGYLLLPSKHHKCAWLVVEVSLPILSKVSPARPKSGAIDFLVKCGLAKETRIVEEPALAYERVVRVEVRTFTIAVEIASDLQDAIYVWLLRSDL